jgi:hypothetical protein
MIKESTYIKIHEIELQYGSLVNALESCKIEKSTYYRWRKIVITKAYCDFVVNKIY